MYINEPLTEEQVRIWQSSVRVRQGRGWQLCNVKQHSGARRPQTTECAMLFSSVLHYAVLCSAWSLRFAQNSTVEHSF